jgi:hypothetical protein
MVVVLLLFHLWMTVGVVVVEFRRNRPPPLRRSTMMPMLHYLERFAWQVFEV